MYTALDIWLKVTRYHVLCMELRFWKYKGRAQEHEYADVCFGISAMFPALTNIGFPGSSLEWPRRTSCSRVRSTRVLGSMSTPNESGNLDPIGTFQQHTFICHYDYQEICWTVSHEWHLLERFLNGLVTTLFSRVYMYKIMKNDSVIWDWHLKLLIY